MKIILWGMLTGVIAMLRLNMLSIFLGFYIIIGIELIAKKEFKEIFRWIGFGILGVVITIIPVIIYLVKTDCLMECLDSAYFGIMDGFTKRDALYKLKAFNSMSVQFNCSFGMILILSFLIGGTILILTRKINGRENKKYIWGIIIASIINIYANTIASADQMHYMITFIPILCMCISVIIKVYDKLQRKYIEKSIILGALICVISIYGYSKYLEMTFKDYPLADKIGKGLDIYINLESDKDDLIQFIGGRAEAVGANYRNKRFAASKYSYLPLWNTFSVERKQEIVNEVAQDLKENKPKLIFICEYSLTGERKTDEEFYMLLEDKIGWEEFLNKNYIQEESGLFKTMYRIYKRK
ncbi:MAG: hypothetical protein HFJ50_04440 [Clostridia bacterium]|jgi:hypothetical protein|nr:hypothetical protein [Clostridia bacterium]